MDGAYGRITDLVALWSAVLDVVAGFFGVVRVSRSVTRHCGGCDLVFLVAFEIDEAVV